MTSRLFRQDPVPLNCWRSTGVPRLGVGLVVLRTHLDCTQFLSLAFVLMYLGALGTVGAIMLGFGVCSRVPFGPCEGGLGPCREPADEMWMSVLLEI